MINDLNQERLLIASLVFLALSGGYYLWLWWSGFIREKREAGKIDLPWE